SGETGAPYAGSVFFNPPSRRGAGAAPAMKGERLRDRRAPSVSELMARRAVDIQRTGNPGLGSDFRLTRACDMGLALARWDEPVSLPTLNDLLRMCLQRSLNTQRDDPSGSNRGHYIARLTLVLVRAGRTETLDAYATWVRA